MRDFLHEDCLSLFTLDLARAEKSTSILITATLTPWSPSPSRAQTSRQGEGERKGRLPWNFTLGDQLAQNENDREARSVHRTANGNLAMANSKGRFRWWMLPVGIIVGLGLTGVLLTNNVERKFEAEMALSKKAGLAVSAEDLRKNPASSLENSAGFYQQAISERKGLSVDIRNLAESYYVYSDVAELKRSLGTRYKGNYDEAAIREALMQWKPVFTRLDEATSRPRMDFQRQWEKGYNLMFPELADMKAFAKALASDATVKAKSGDSTAAIARLNQIRKIGDHCFDEPTLISQLVGAAAIAIANRAAVRMAVEYPKDAVLREKLQAFFSQSPAVPDLMNGFRGETFFMVTGPEQMASDPKAFESMEGQADWQVRAMRIKWIRRSAQTASLKLYREAAAEMPTDLRDWKKVEETFKKMDLKVSSDQSLIGKIASTFTPVFANAGQVGASAIQRQELGRAVCAVMAEKAKTGRYPKQLPKIPNQPLDIFADAPLKYNVTPTGFMIYSVGPDRVDKKGESGDLCVTVENGIIKRAS